MKLNKWLYGAAALAMLAACSERDVAPGGGDPGNIGTNENVNGYIAVEIKLPEDAGTRADEPTGQDGENDYFKDGTENEYQVKNALIAIFKGKNEKDAKFVRAQALKKPFFTSTPADDNITSSYLAAIEVQTEVADGDVFWAWVILNSNIIPDKDTSEANESSATNLSKFTIGGVEVKADGENGTGATTFGYILENAIITDSDGTDSFVTGNGKTASKFFMTNAPMSNVVGNNNVKKENISYLTEIGSKVYDTIEEAKAAKDRACVYVERAVAKLTCTEFTKENLDLEFYDENGAKIDTKNWKIDGKLRYALTNTPYESYVIRNVELVSEDDNDIHFDWSFNRNDRYRFVSLTSMPSLGNPFHSETKNFYRTYWCKDPHYSTDLTKKKIAGIDDLKPCTTPLYCKENTFTVENQNYKNTNIAIFELDLTIEGPQDASGNKTSYSNLYIKDGNNSKIYVSKHAVYADGISRILNDLTLQSILKECVASGKTLPTDEHGTINIPIKKFLDYDWNESGDMLEISKIKLVKTAEGFNDYFDDSSVTKFNEKMGEPSNETSAHHKILQDVNGLSDVSIYRGGKSYYAIPVKHFGDYYTPWGKDQDGNDIVGVTTKEVYNPSGKSAEWDKDHARLYLGRYGMVRNNWYELNVSKIQALGSQSIPDVELTLSDDNNLKKQYFAVEIHILSWAKRTQDVHF